MRILSAELRKTLTLRFFLILLVAIVANFLLFRHGLKGEYSSYGVESYVSAQQDLIDMEEEARLPYLQQRQQMLAACSAWERYDRFMQSGSNLDDEITEEMLKYKDIYESGEYLKYTYRLQSESSLNRRLLEQIQQVENHRTTLETAIEDAKLKTSMSIFSKPGTFDHSSQLATVEKLESLLHIEPQYDISDGVIQSQNSAVTDLICLMLILFLCTEMVVAEQKNGMLPILRTTRKGRMSLIVSKVVAVFVLTLLVTCALWGANSMYCGITFGFGDLTRPVQSLVGYTTSTMEISVGCFMVLRFLLKWMLYAFVGLLCLIFGLLLGGAMPTWMAVGGFLCIEYILAQIPVVSAWNLLKYMNLSNLIFTSNWLSEYRNLNLFGQPAEVLTASYVLLAVLVVGGALLSCFLFCKRNICALPIPKLKFGWPKWLPRPGKSTALFGHESWKLMIECGALLVLLLFVFLNVQTPDYVTFTSNDLYYKNYMLSMEGPVGEKTDAYLEAEYARFQGIRTEIAELNRIYSEGKISSTELSILTSPLSRQLEAEKILDEMVLPQIKRAKAMAAEGKECWLLYNVGYEYLFGLASHHDKTGAAALLLTGIILCFSNVYPLETTTGMLPLLNTYKRGRRETAVTKLLLCGMVTVVLFVLTQIPDYWYVLQNYDFLALSAPLCSMEAFGTWGDGISVLGGLVIFEALRLMTALSVMAIVMAVCLWTKNQIVTMSASAGVILLPLLLHLLDITFLNKVSFYLPLNGAGLLAYQESAVKALLYYGIVLLIGTGCIFFTFHYVGQGYRYKLKRNMI